MKIESIQMSPLFAPTWRVTLEPADTEAIAAAVLEKLGQHYDPSVTSCGSCSRPPSAKPLCPVHDGGEIALLKDWVGRLETGHASQLSALDDCVGRLVNQVNQYEGRLSVLEKSSAAVGIQRLQKSLEQLAVRVGNLQLGSRGDRGRFKSLEEHIGKLVSMVVTPHSDAGRAARAFFQKPVGVVSATPDGTAFVLGPTRPVDASDAMAFSPPATKATKKKPHRDRKARGARRVPGLDARR